MRMRTVKVVLVLFLGVLLCSAAVGQKANYGKKIDKFLAGILKGEIDKSYDALFAGTVIEPKKQAIQMIKEQTRTIFNLYGKKIASEFIKQQNYGDSVLRLVYIIKCESLPVIYEFYFYKATSDWKLINMNVSDQLNLLADR